MNLAMTSRGLYCPAGGFYIDPKRAVETAVITHAHSDHARPGCGIYYCARSGVGLLRTRLGPKAEIRGIDYGTTFELGRSRLSFHPAGHILGSAQVRIDWGGPVWVVTGDYKRDGDPS